MKRIFIALCLALFSYQTFAATVAGIDFSEIAGTLVTSEGSFLSNDTGIAGGIPVASPTAIVDGNAASYVMSLSDTATLDVSFGSAPLNVANRNLTILLVGNDAPHSIGVSLLGGTDTSSDTFSINSTIDNLLGYTGYNSVTPPAPPTSEQPISGGPTVWGIYALNINLAGSFSGSFTGVQLDISGLSAAPSLVGTVAVVPVPAAVWLFGSGLIGLAGIARKKRA